MSELKARYKRALERMRDPVDSFACEKCLDVRALLAYARERSVRANELPLEDVALFVKPRSRHGTDKLA